MKLRYKTLITISILGILSYLLVFYVNHTLIPVKLKRLLTERIARQIHKEVEIESLRFSIAKGFILNGAKIYEGPRENNQFLFKAEKISFGIIFLPSLKRHHLIIPRLSLYEPYLNLERSQAGDYNISSLFKKEAKKEKGPRFDFTLKSLSFDEGQLSFADYYNEKVFQRSLRALKGSAGFSLPASVTFNCTGKLDDSPLKIISRFKPLKKELFIALETKDLILADYSNLYLAALSTKGELDKLRIHSGLADASLRINVLNFEEVKAKVDFSLRNLFADFKDLSVSGDYKLTGEANLNLKDLTGATYNLNLELDKARITTPLKPLKDLDRIEGLLSLSEKRWATKELSCLLYNSPAVITGEVSSPHKDFIIDIKLSSTMALKNIAEDAGIIIESGEAEVNTKITYQKDKNYRISGKSEIKNLKLQQKEVLISGDFLITGESSGIAGDLESLKYKGQMNFSKAKIAGAGRLPFISDASGLASFSTRHINIKRLSGLAADTKITLSGTIDYAQEEPALALKLKTDDLSLEKFLSSLPEEIRTDFKDIDLKGICSLNLDFSGTAGVPSTFRYEGGLLLKKGSLAIPYWPNNLSNIDCEISFNKDEIVWKSLRFDIDAIPYHSYGRFSDFARPNISLTIKSKDIDLMGEIKIEEKIIDIIKCEGKFLNSDFSITGKISDIKTAYAELSGNLNFDLRDSLSIFKAHEDILNKLKPEGIIPLTFNMRGPLKEVADWTLYLEGGANSIRLRGLSLDDFYIDFRMKEGFIDIPAIAAYPYGGIINISSRANLKKAKDKPYIINIDIKDVDLHKLVEDTEFKNKKIKGSFAAKTILNGYLDQKDSLKGTGWLQVSDGYLWEFPVMHDMLEVLLMLPPEYVTLTDAFGNFSVHNNRIHTEDFKILSKTASLLWAGSLGFNGTMDFNITGRFAEDIVKQTTQPGKIASALLREAGSLIMEIKLTGSLAKPKYQIVPFPVKRIFQEKVVDRLKDIFGDVFD